MVWYTQSWRKIYFLGQIDCMKFTRSSLGASWTSFRFQLLFGRQHTIIWRQTHTLNKQSKACKWPLSPFVECYVFFFQFHVFLSSPLFFFLHIHSLLAYFLRFFQVVISHHLCLRPRAPPTKTEFHFFRSFFSFLSPFTLLSSPQRLVDLHSVLSAHVKQTRAPKYLQKVFFLYISFIRRAETCTISSIGLDPFFVC